MSKKPTILFDIDGTLIRTQGAGRSAIDQTILNMFGIENQERVPLAGRTDFAILTDLFAANQIDFESHYREFSERYHHQLKLKLETVHGEVLPGIHSLLRELQSKAFPLGIVTGNGENAAWHKLERFQLGSYFSFGGYGDDFANRNDVAAQAVVAAKRRLNEDFCESLCWVIGDTPADVDCAISIGAKAIAVLTGGFERNDFENSQATQILDDLSGLTPDFFL